MDERARLLAIRGIIDEARRENAEAIITAEQQDRVYHLALAPQPPKEPFMAPKPMPPETQIDPKGAVINVEGDLYIKIHHEHEVDRVGSLLRIQPMKAIKHDEKFKALIDAIDDASQSSQITLTTDGDATLLNKDLWTKVMDARAALLPVLG